nr:YetF domain-containing protein [Variovorax boronicumulans]
MFEMSLPWWELVLRGTAVYAVLLLLMRLSGKRTVGQFTPFDLLVVMLLSEGVSNALTGGEQSLVGGLIAACTLLGLNALVSRLSARSDRIRKLTEGEPVVVGYGGRILEDRLRAEHVTREDVLEALREADCDVADMKLALLEADGRISILRQAKDMAAHLRG